MNKLPMPVICECGFNTMDAKEAVKHTEKHHTAEYNGKVVCMAYVEPKEEFKYACMRIIDNGANGIVITPDGKRYEVNQSSRKAKLIRA